MKRLLGFTVSDPLWEAFARADKLAIKLGMNDIPSRFELAEGELFVLVPEEEIEAAAKLVQLTP